MSVIRAGPIAICPGGLVDREPAIAVARMEGAVFGRLALPVDDVSR